MKRHRSTFRWVIIHENVVHLFDLIPCIRCTSLLFEDHVWLTPHRSSGWPPKEIVYEIYKGGFHIVPITHPSSRDDNKQWRLSYSKAERLLIRRWSVRQKVVYHTLKYVCKAVSDELGEKSVLKRTTLKR